MSCSQCGTSCGGTCNVCQDNPCNSCASCKTPCIRWGFDDCYLRGRCADGSELDPLNLCEWLRQHETCTEFMLVPVTGEDSTAAMSGSYMQFTNECGIVSKIYVCDFLGLGSLECLGNVNDRSDAQPCDLLVFSPDCGNPCSETYNKWTHYRIPDAGDCVLEPDDQGYYKVLVKNDCGCIEECKFFAVNKTWEYSLRDSWPDDPDWPFSMGSRIGANSEIIDLELDTRVDMFGKADLKVTVMYAYGIQNTDPASTGLNGNYNFKSIVTPTYTPTHNPGVTDMIGKAIVVQGCNLLPWGSWEWQVSRTFLVPKGRRLYLNHTIEMRDGSATLIRDFWGESSAPNRDSSRLHALHVLVEPTKGA